MKYENRVVIQEYGEIVYSCHKRNLSKAMRLRDKYWPFGEITAYGNDSIGIVPENEAIEDILAKHRVQYGDDFSAMLTIKPKMYIDLFLYYRSTMPYEYQKAREKDPYIWIEVRLEGLLGTGE